jgi:hypothetical protein
MGEPPSSCRRRIGAGERWLWPRVTNGETGLSFDSRNCTHEGYGPIDARIGRMCVRVLYHRRMYTIT